MNERRFALLIGNSDYQDAKLGPLGAPVHDVEDLQRVLAAPNIGGFESIEVLTNKPAEMVRKAIAQFFAGKNRNDLLVVYFSGHGIIDKDGALYLAVANTESDFPSVAGVEARFITQEMNKHSLRRVILILDCCYSGAFGRSTKGIPDLGVTFNSGYGRIVLTASNAIEEAWDGSQVVDDTKHSLFTYYLIEGLETGAAGGESEWITVDDLYTYAYTKVIQTPKPKPQTPQKWGERQEGAPIIIARNPRLEKLHVPVIAVMGVKGGVGKGTFVSCVSQLLAESGVDVAVIDFDLETSGFTRSALSQTHDVEFFVKTVYDHIAPYAEGFVDHHGSEVTRLWDITPEYLSERHLGKIWLLPASDPSRYTRRWDVIANVPPPRMQRLLDLTTEVIARVRQEQPSIRCILIDCGAGTNPIYSAAFASADYGYIIATPDLAYLEEITRIRDEHRRRYNLYSGADSRRIFIVINRVTSIADRERGRPYKPVGFIPRDPTLEQDQFRGGSVDFDLGYDDVSLAVRECLTSSLSSEDVKLVPDEIDVRIRPWWTRLVKDGWASRILKSPAFWRQTILSWGLLLVSFIALLASVFPNLQASLTGHQRQLPGYVGIISGILVLPVTGLFVWSIYRLIRHERRRILLRRVSRLTPEDKMTPDHRAFLQDLLTRADRSSLKWLRQLLQEAQEKEKLRRLQR